MDKPRKHVHCIRLGQKRSSPEDSIGDKENEEHGLRIFNTPQNKRKIFSKEYKENMLYFREKSGKVSAKTTPSPSQKNNSAPISILKWKHSAAELFNSAALTENICGRENEKTDIAKYLSPYFSNE